MRIAGHDTAANDLREFFDFDRRRGGQRPDDLLRRVDVIVVWLESGQQDHKSFYSADFASTPWFRANRTGVLRATAALSTGRKKRRVRIDLLLAVLYEDAI
jgi:hypothetical protein